MSSFENLTMNGTLLNKNITTDETSDGSLIYDVTGIVVMILIVVFICSQYAFSLYDKLKSRRERAPPPGVQIPMNDDVPQDSNPPTPKPAGRSASPNPMPPKPNPDFGPGTASTIPISDVLESSSDLSSHNSTTASISSENQHATPDPSDISGSQQIQTRDSNFTADSSVDPGTYYLRSNSNSSLDVDTLHPTCAMILQDVRTYEVPEGLDRSEDNDGCRTRTSHSNPAIMLQDLGMCKVVDCVPGDHSDDSGICMKTVRSDSAIIMENLRGCHVFESTDQSNDSQIETFRMRHILEDTGGLNNNVGHEALTLDPDPTPKSEDLEMSHL